MRVEVNVLESGTEPGVLVQHQSTLMMALRTGSIEVGSRRSEMKRFTFGVGEMCLVPRHVETWLRTDDSHYSYLSVDISDAALAAACDGTRGDVELCRVGIENLRIADGSIMPRVTTGNTMAPCIVIGERAAQAVRSDHRLQTSSSARLVEASRR